MKQTDSLRDILSQQLTGEAYDRASVHREKFLVDHLVEKVREWEIGDLTYAELLQAFAPYADEFPRFDFEAWLDDNYDDPSDETEADD